MSDARPEAEGTPDLGVLFVHGIGSQRQSDTLVRWGDALASWLDGWSTAVDPDRSVRFRSAQLHPSDPEPAHGMLEIPSGSGPVTWVVAEAYWGGDFSTPTYAALASWVVQTLPITVFGHVMGGIRRARQHRSAAKGVARAYHAAGVALWAVLGVPAALVAIPLLAALMLLLLVVGLLPIPFLRSAVARVQRMLTGSVGDSLILLGSPTQSAAMTSRVELGVRYLRETLACPRVVVVAHSQGAAVTSRALAGSSDEPVDGLVTLGSGINKLEELRALRQRSLAAWAPPALLLAGLFLGLWIWSAVDAGETRWRGIAILLGVFLLGGVLTVGATSLALRYIKSDRAQTYVIVALLLTFVVALVVVGEREIGDTSFPVFLLALALLGLAGGIAQLAGEVGHPVGANLIGHARAWLDLQAYADPVPNGPTRTDVSGWPWSVEVHNLDSTVRDHSYYSRAIDDSLARIVAFLLTQSPRAPQLAPDDEARIIDAARQRQWRLLWLRWTRWLVALATLGFLWRHRSQLEQISESAYDAVLAVPGLPSWLPQGVQGSEATFVGVLAVLAAGSAAYLLLAAVWKMWDRAAGEQLLGRKASAEFPGQLRALLVAWASLIAVVVWVDRVPAVAEIGSSWRDWVGGAVLFIVVVVAWVSVVPALVGKAKLFERLTQEPAPLRGPAEARR